MHSENGKNHEQGVVHPEKSDLDVGHRHRHAFIIGGVILLACVLAAEIPIARSGFGLAAAGYGAATLLWLTLLRQARLHSIAVRTPWLLVIAVILRLPFFFADPTLSGDVYRYRWDGIVTASGVSPYAYAPDASELSSLRDELHGSINHPEIPTIYPPLAQAFFFVWGLTGAGLWLWRLLLLAIDLTIVGLSGRRVGSFWATCPLVIFEGIWSGHLELLVAVAMYGAWLAIEDKRDAAGGILGALATGLKITPVASLPAIVMSGHRRLRVALAAVLTLLIPFVPFVGGPPIMRGLRDYAVRWEFNGAFYHPIKWLVEVSSIDEGLKALFTSIKDPLGLERVAGFVYGHLYPAWIARSLCLIPLAVLFVLAMKRPTVAGRIAWGVAALLLASPTVHPWYWLAILPLAVVASERLLLSIALASPLSYAWYVGAAGSKASSMLLCYVLPVVIWFVGRRYGRR